MSSAQKQKLAANRFKVITIKKPTPIQSNKTIKVSALYFCHFLCKQPSATLPVYYLWKFVTAINTCLWMWVDNRSYKLVLFELACMTHP